MKRISISKDLEELYAQDIYVDNYGHKYSHDSLLKGILKSSIWGDDIRKHKVNWENPNIILDPSLFEKNPKGWNVEKACNWLQGTAVSHTTHKCAMVVRSAIDVGFNTDPDDCNSKSPTCSYTLKNGRPRWAWMYINFLPKIGFKHIGTYKEKGYSPIPGDIAVYFKNGNPNVPGHICMWTGIQWCSDFRQNNMIVYPSTKEAYIFRFQ